MDFNVSSRLADDGGQRFANAFKAALVAVIKAGVAAAEAGGVHTPSDYGVAGLSLARLEALQSCHDIEAIYPATSLQQGFIVHHLSQPQDDAYRVQVLLDYAASLDTHHPLERRNPVGDH